MAVAMMNRQRHHGDDGSRRQTAQRVALVVAPLSSFINPFMGSSINVGLKAIEQDLGFDAALLGWVQTAFLVASAAVLVPVGRLSDIRGRRRIFLIGTALFSAASLLAGLSWNVPSFLAARVLQGLSSSMMVANAVSILVSVFPPHRRGRVIGVNVAAVYAGLALGPVLGGQLTHRLSWRGIFLAAVPLGLLAGGLTATRLRGEWADARGERFDRRGAAIYALSIPALMAGLALLPAPGGAALLAAGAAGLAWFVRHSLGRTSPIYPVQQLRDNRVFALSNLAAMLSYASSYAVPFLMSLYLQHLRGQDAATAGLVLVVQPATMAVVTPLAGRLADRFQPRWLVSLGLGLHAAGLALLARLGASASLESIVAVLALIGCGLGLFSSPNISAIVGSVGKRWYGVASASAGTTRLLGQSQCMAIVTVVTTVVIGRVALGPAHHGALLTAMHWTFAICFAVALAALLASALRGKLEAD